MRRWTRHVTLFPALPVIKKKREEGRDRHLPRFRGNESEYMNQNVPESLLDVENFLLNCPTRSRSSIEHRRKELSIRGRLLAGNNSEGHRRS